MEQIQQFSNQINSATSQVEQWINAITNLSKADWNRKSLQDLASALSNLKLGNADQAKIKPVPPPSDKNDKKEQKAKADNPEKDQKAKSGNPEKDQKTTSFKPHSPDGDSLYDLINAPTFADIVDKVMKSRQRKR